MNKARPWLLLLILAALALRLALLGRQSLWYDEGVTWWLTQMSPPELVRWTAADIQPPLYYLLLWLTSRLFGASEWALRFPSAIFNVLTVPLFYFLARRLLGRPAALLATLLLAVSPLMVYYSQEARMYTLLVFEAVLASSLLLRLLALGPAAGWRAGLAYALAATAALYTHYFALFLLVAHGLYVLFVLGRQRWPRPLLGLWLRTWGLIVLLFGPWLPVLLARLGDDPSYWPGRLKAGEALRHVLISFSLGETVSEQIGFWLSLNILLLAGYWLFETGVSLWEQHASRSRLATTSSRFPLPSGRAALFLLLWLLLPLGLALALAYASPKFNPRYALLAWPAFALILAGGLARFLPAAPRSPLTLFQTLLFAFFGLYLLVTAGLSLGNWYADPRFAKDDFKALARFVAERIGPDETVLLSSGHMFPVWAYYYGWQGWTPLPRLARLDVRRVIGLNITGELAPALAGKKGAWLVGWQDEVLDPNGVIPFWLDQVGERPGDAGDFQGVRLEHWRLKPAQLERLTENPIQHPAAFNFANAVDLLGLTQLSDTELALFWRPRRPLPDNLALTFDLTDEDGFDWDQGTFAGRPGAYLYPPSRWPVGQVIMTRQPLAWLPGTPPGLYRAEIGLGLAGAGFSGWDILDETGRPQRRTVLLEPVKLSRLVPAEKTFPRDSEPLIDFRPIIAVRHAELSRPAAEPGDRLLLRLLWQAGEYNFDDVSVAFDLVDAAGLVLRVGSALTPSRQFNLPAWQPGDVVLGQYWLDIPPATSAGPAALRLHIVNSHAYPYDEAFALAGLDILPTERVFNPPSSLGLPLAADFSGQVRLLGLDCQVVPSAGGTDETSAPACPPLAARPGQILRLTLYWQAAATPAASYTVFTHLLDSGDRVVLNADHAPPRPSHGWTPGEVIADPVSLALPADLPPGDYRLEIGLYNAADPALPRLPLAGGETRVLVPQPVRVE